MNSDNLKDKMAAKAKALEDWQKAYSEKVDLFNERVNKSGWNEERKETAIDYYLEKIDKFEKILLEYQGKGFINDINKCDQESKNWYNKTVEVLQSSIIEAKNELKEIVNIKNNPANMSTEIAIKRTEELRKETEKFFNYFLENAKALNQDLEKSGWTAELKQQGINLDIEKIRWIGVTLAEFKDESIFKGLEETIRPMVEFLNTMLAETAKHLDDTCKIVPKQE